MMETGGLARNLLTDCYDTGSRQTRAPRGKRMSRFHTTALAGMILGLSIGTIAGAQAPAQTPPADPSQMPSANPSQMPPATGAPAPGGSDLAAADAVSQQWIALVDAGQYAESWQAAGKLFQANMPQQNWVQALTSARTPLGKATSREMTGHEAKTDIPGAPAGQYALVGFATNFEAQADIIETVTLYLEDGQWKVVGYTAAPRKTAEEAAAAAQGQGTQGQPGQPAPEATPPPAETPQDPPLSR